MYVKPSVFLSTFSNPVKLLFFPLEKKFYCLSGRNFYNMFVFNTSSEILGSTSTHVKYIFHEFLSNDSTHQSTPEQDQNTIMFVIKLDADDFDHAKILIVPVNHDGSWVVSGHVTHEYNVKAACTRLKNQLVLSHK